MAGTGKGRFTDKAVAALVEPGRHRDPGTSGLYLQVLSPSSRSWLFRYQFSGKPRQMGLGAYPTVTLAEARDKAAAARKLMASGIDPLTDRAAAALDAKAAEAKRITFKAAATQYIDGHKAEWSNAKHGKQWTATLEAYAFPTLGQLAVSDIDAGLVVRALEPIWSTKTETATRVRQRIEAILDWAAVMGYRQGENPAVWKGHLQNALPKPSKVRTFAHHAALAYGDVPSFWQQLAGQSSVSALCLRWVILTACRTGEAIAATWDEIDTEKAVWTIPANRMKAGKEHRVPLSQAALDVLTAIKPMGRKDGYIFPGMKAGMHVSNMAMLVLLKRMDRAALTVHGFRSTFRDWAAERTAFAREVCEAALAHTIENATEAAYRRGDLFEKRTKLMEAWGEFATTPPAESFPTDPCGAPAEGKCQ